MTLHAIVLNLCKYFVYFVAIGFALSELGVNYTTYLASLSVLGLAIGFGSQGLVQDMVTGFFILFEGQFAVGDLVEIAGQTGIVEDLGLRMTRLRNYLGQTVVIPNRSIAVVGTYTLGAQQAYVDVAMRSAEAAAQAAPLLQQVATEVARQFAGVVLQPPRVLEPLVLETGERFLRLHLGIWPQQPWVVEQQLVPRLREACQRAGIEIPGDRVVVFYRPREARPVLPWSRSPRAAGATERASPRPAPETPQA
ncbi:MAG: hypothetical protein KatS3mg131_1471 [Candidatus Tectimicrobiota bacterium]|nr:MAG: hypothetical protein KatS3mg131_1471 [Candidatus Tectomicrobia bacterium]